VILSFLVCGNFFYTALGMTEDPLCFLKLGCLFTFFFFLQYWGSNPGPHASTLYHRAASWPETGRFFVCIWDRVLSYSTGWPQTLIFLFLLFDGVIWSTKNFIVIKCKWVIFAFFAHAFGGIQKNPLLNPRSSRFNPILFKEFYSFNFYNESFDPF
jgi:hypothetical protein